MSVLTTLGQAALLDLAIQWTVGGLSILLQTEKLYDLTGSSTFLVLVLFTLCFTTASSSSFTTRQLLLSSLVVLWALRLGSFLFVRVLQEGKDRRFDRAKTQPLLFLLFWTIQAVWVLLTALPVYVVNIAAAAAEGAKEEQALGWLDWLGVAMWLVGFLVESIADYQKFVFRADPRNQNHFIQTGLWRYSRHPNYAGEIVLWWGIFLLSFSSLPSTTWRALCLFSPCFVMFLLTKVSGVPLLEKANDKKWGQQAAYQHYKKTTPVLFPFLSS
ncbi:Steroid 5-alpha reductase family enzyme [Balamuthia mandrillaris]